MLLHKNESSLEKKNSFASFSSSKSKSSKKKESLKGEGGDKNFEFLVRSNKDL